MQSTLLETIDTFDLASGRQLIVPPDQICNPLRNEPLHIPVRVAKAVGLDIGGECVLCTVADDQVVPRYRVRIGLIHVARSDNRPAESLLSIRQRLDGNDWLNAPCAPVPLCPCPSFLIFAEPIEDDPPNVSRLRWRLGRHGQFCSITVPPEPRMYIVRTETLFGETVSTRNILTEGQGGPDSEDRSD